MNWRSTGCTALVVGGLALAGCISPGDTSDASTEPDVPPDVVDTTDTTVPREDGTVVCACQIGNTCAAAGERNLEDACQVCEPSSSTDDWTALRPGQTCSLPSGPLSYCNAVGACVSAPDCVESVTVHNDANGPLYNLLPGTCLIDGLCYALGESRDDNPCRVCGDAKRSWTALPLGTNCKDGQKASFCDPDGCAPVPECVGRLDWVSGGPVATPLPDRCFIGGQCYLSGETAGSGSCQLCQPASGGQGATEWSIRADSCLINGSCWPEGQMGPCAICDPSQSQVEPIALDQLPCAPEEPCLSLGVCDGFECVSEPLDCDDGLACTADSCGEDGCANVPTSGCVAEDACYAVNERGPTGCDVCVVSDEGVSDWEPVMAGTPCDLALDCYAGACDAQGVCVEALLPTDSDNDQIPTQLGGENLSNTASWPQFTETGVLNPLGPASSGDRDRFAYAVSMPPPTPQASFDRVARADLTNDGDVPMLLCGYGGCGAFGEAAPALGLECPNAGTSPAENMIEGFSGCCRHVQPGQTASNALLFSCPEDPDAGVAGKVIWQVTQGQGGISPSGSMCAPYTLELGLNIQ